MSLTFNHMPRHIEEYLKREALRREQAVEDVAVEALERGLAFADGPGDEKDGGEEPVTFVEDPNFEKALETFAQMNHE